MCFIFRSIKDYSSGMFAQLFKLVIHVYWIIVPKKLRGVCLFKESCSRSVYRELCKAGFLSGWREFRFRYYNCRTPYSLIISDQGVPGLHLCTGEILNESEVSPVIWEEEMNRNPSIKSMLNPK